VDAEKRSELAALAAKVDELSRVCAQLSQENAQLHGMVARMTAAPARAEDRDAAETAPTRARRTPPVRGPMSRRSIGKALGAAAAGVVGAAVLTDATAGPAAAANGDVMKAGTSVTSDSGAATGVEYAGSTNPGAIFAADDSGSFAGTLLGTVLNNHTAALLGNGTTTVNNGVFGNTAHPDGGDGVVGVNNSKGGGTGVHGIAKTGIAVGVLGENGGGIAVEGKGGSLGVFGTGTTGVYGLSSTSGIGVAGSGQTGVRGASSTGTGVRGSGKTGVGGSGSGTNSVGVAGAGTASGGRGGVFAGNAAQVKLVPGSKPSHPSSGQRGDLYADSKGRLWFCKGGTSWHQLA
jgi:hypothetical protein